MFLGRGLDARFVKRNKAIPTSVAVWRPLETKIRLTPASKDAMFVQTDIAEAPWYVVESDDKRSARINMIAHLLSTIPYQDVREKRLKLPHRPRSEGYVRSPRDLQTYVPDHAAKLHG